MLPEKEPRLTRFARDLAGRITHLPGQLLMRSPFSGTLEVQRLAVFRSIRTTLSHLRNPLTIIDKAFDTGCDLSYLDIPCFTPILYARDPQIIKDVLAQTGESKSFERG